MIARTRSDALTRFKMRLLKFHEFHSCLFEECDAVRLLAVGLKPYHTSYSGRHHHARTGQARLGGDVADCVIQRDSELRCCRYRVTLGMLNADAVSVDQVAWIAGAG